jgi:hypothetical protein
MSLAKINQLLRCVGIAAVASLVLPAVSWAQPGCLTCATFGTPSTSTGNCCQTLHCPPAYHHCYERPPCIHWKCGCPHPICNPCDLPHWGVYDKCWTPWPFPPNWTHCPTPPPAAYVTLNPYANLPPVRSTQPSYQTPSGVPVPPAPGNGGYSAPNPGIDDPIAPTPRILEGGRPRF